MATALNEVLHTKYLGVFIDKGLTWSKHIDYIASKANQALAFLQRNLISCPTQVKINCYKSFVCPIMDYCSTVWSPYTLCNINKIEAIQRRAARFVLNDYYQYSSVTDMLNRLSWQPLQIHRSSLKLIMFYKIVNQLVNIPSRHLKETCCCSRKHSQCYQQMQTRIDAYANSFFPSTIKLWNNLNERQMNMTLETFTNTLNL